jgi:hypothetical protein
MNQAQSKQAPPFCAFYRYFEGRSSIGSSPRRGVLLDSGVITEVGGTDVNLTLKLNMLAVCAVFVFVGAILFGAF